MLKLQVKEYCHECDSFIPKLDELDMYKNGKKIYIGDRTITCDNLDKCNKIEKYVRGSNKPPNEP